MSDDRRVLVERAKLAEQAERWGDVVQLMKTVVQLGRELTVEERNLLATGYKNFVGTKRSAWRVVTAVEQKIEGNQRRRELSSEYRRKIESELNQCCNELVTLLDMFLISTIDNENKIFYLKMKGDYFRYIAEFSRDGKGDDIFEKAKRAYEEAVSLSKEHLNPAHPIRLGLILNYTVFYYEILNAYEKACDIAKENITLAKEDGHHGYMAESARNDSDAILQLLQDNLTLWSVDMDGLTNSRHSAGLN